MALFPTKSSLSRLDSDGNVARDTPAPSRHRREETGNRRGLEAFI